MSNEVRAPWRRVTAAAAAMVVAAIGALPAAAMAQSDVVPSQCTTLVKGGGLPGGADGVYQGVYSNNQPVAYRVWQDLCYGDALPWQEWVSPNHWVAGDYRKLVQRFDLYLPAVAQTSLVPLVIYAHPMGQTENLDPNNPNDKHFEVLVGQAMAGGYALASIEFRHPTGSFVDPVVLQYPTDFPHGTHPDVTVATIPNDDVSTAVRFMKFMSTDLRIQPKNVFVAAQSRGTLGILDALMDPKPLDPNATNSWRSKNSKVNAIVAYQAQTTYNENEVASTFIKPDGTRPNQTWFHEDYPDVIGDPGSAAALADLPATVRVPIRISYDNTYTMDLSGTAPIQRQCYQSNNQNRGYQHFVPVTPPDCPLGQSVFDVHDPRFGQLLFNKYKKNAADSLIKVCTGVGKDNVALGFANYIAVFNQYRDGAIPPMSACPTQPLN